MSLLLLLVRQTKICLLEVKSSVTKFGVISPLWLLGQTFEQFEHTLVNLKSTQVKFILL